MVNKIKSFLKKKKIIKKINICDYLILEQGHDMMFLKYLNKKKLQFVYFNYSLNIYLIILLILNLKKIDQFNYYKLAIKLSKPKFVLTATDNSTSFYRLKKFFPNIKFISIQNGYRSEELFEKEEISQNLICDAIFCLGKQNISYYKSKITSDVIPIGCMKNNSIIPPKNIDLLNCLTYISEYRSNKKINYISKNYISQYNLNYHQYKNFIESEIEIIRLLYLISKKKKLPFYIVGCSSKNQKEEAEWYQYILKDKNLNFQPKENYKSSYNFLLKSKYIANIDSTLGYEFLTRGKKVIFISRDFKDEKIQKYWRFGWPSVKEKKGFFFTDTINENEINRILDNLISSSTEIWNSEIKIYRENLINLDLGNKIFVNYIKKFHE